MNQWRQKMWIDHGGNRYKIIYGKYDGCEKEAVDTLYAEVQQYVPYVLAAGEADGFDETELNKTDDNYIIIGTTESNRLLEKLGNAGSYVVQNKKEGYSLKVYANPQNIERCIIIIQGADGNGVLYGAADFSRWYVNHTLKYHGVFRSRRPKPFIDPFAPFERQGAPAIDHRGLWTWGHVIYDYRGYIKNMRECKMNSLIIWNDYVPINAREIIQYAHRNGVKVIWGYSWCWGADVNPNDPVEKEKWRIRALEIYEKQYRDLPVDGIYFQAFTETAETRIGNVSISDLVVDWVNDIAASFYEKYPDLWIQFGVHATSIKNEYRKFEKIDPRMSLVWEDIACDGDHIKGAFPYIYETGNDERYEEAFDYTKETLAIRGANERFGAVFKGFTTLNWKQFEPQKGPFILGEATAAFKEKRAKEKDYDWAYSAGDWITKTEKLKKITRLAADAKIKDRFITALVEDGMWESGVRIGAALYAECLWDPHVNSGELLSVLFQSGYKV
jgi:hypothetical protein